MKAYKKEITGERKELFIKRLNILLASQGRSVTYKTAEIVYYILYYKSQDNDYKNMNQMHVQIAKELGVYSSYIGAYVTDHIVPKGLLTRNIVLPQQKFSRHKIEDYTIPEWLWSLYRSKEFKIDLTLIYE
jgi:hypothetical protein